MSNIYRIHNRNALFFLVLMVILPGCYQGEEKVTSTEEDNTGFLFRKETHILYSEIIQDSFEIQVSLPAVYYQRDTVFPVIYSTDANRSFGIISDVVNMLSFPTNEIPGIVIVGIGYPIKGLEEWAANRHSHMTPTYDSTNSANWKNMLMGMTGRKDLIVHSGQAGKFLDFIKKELIPYVESNYRISKTDRAIFGYSLGGLFSLYCLFESPETFLRYFAGSPSTWWDKGVIFKLEENYAENHENLEANLFMSMGTLENRATINNMWRMDSILRNRDFEDLEIHTMEFPDQIHQTCFPEAVTKALITLYDGSDR